MREALSSGISNNFMFYSIDFAEDIPGGSLKKQKNTKDKVVKKALPAIRTKDDASLADTTKKNATIVKANVNITIAPSLDSDGDGVADNVDKCPSIKGSKENNGCPFPQVEGAKVLQMSNDSATYSISFDFDRSELQGEAFAVLKRIVEILKSDNTLMIHISGHADNQGTDYKNMKVSADGAKVTRDYFMNYNIAASRITSSYYGASRPIDNVQQWRNRRVEVTIIKK